MAAEVVITDVNLDVVRDLIVQASDRCSQALAAAFDPLTKMDETMRSNLEEVHLAIWRARWELGCTGGDVVSTPDATGPSDVGIPFSAEAES